MAIVGVFELGDPHWSEAAKIQQGSAMGRLSTKDLEMLAHGQVPRLHRRHRAPASWSAMARAESDRRAKLED
jgi:hypothetical protein